ncbi:DEAD/DEAH box helicase [Candidatus Nitronereus thalassa]|uniref:DEAD/DEAH box helicase n=1 Tax=Candidatus Nitronereus thalassa TaxID=3020898 RepID=A0ABU3K6E5_9BACT|nr:DEAD/DEAH box helicase [Candidatus Nitronereus thalassa]MDT7042004.1 DEAD/DEAH box helicase [Candidatus Nitronereus thalassa]
MNKHDITHHQSTLSPKDASPGFSTLGLESPLLTTLGTLGYEEPTPIQQEAIPPLLAKRDLIGRAATGTGKTAAFTLPLLQRLAHSTRQKNPFALILVPTRELAIQVSEAVHRYGKAQGIGILAIYGGQAIRPQLVALKRGVDVVVATPGRALDHIRRKTLQLKDLQIVVLDEADEMLNMGFAEDLDAILQQTPKTRQTALFSATMPPRIASIARRHLQDPVEIQIIKEPIKAGVAPRVNQIGYLVTRPHKVAALARILDMATPKSTLVFCRTRLEVDELTSALNTRGYRSEGLHGGLNQAQRDRVMASFRSGKTELLVATDVAARGLDISHVSHVMNYDVPSSPEAYVHRIGRTGRAGRTGEAITLVEPREQWLLKNIERLTKSKIEMATLPTVADLQAKRLTGIGTSIQEILTANKFEQFRNVVNTLIEKFDPVDVAAAAIQLAYGSKSGERKEEEIPVIRGHEMEKSRRPQGSKQAPQERSRGAKIRGETGRPAGPRDRGGPSIKMATLSFSAGRNAGIGPRDLVGAIANEAGLPSKMIGPIKIDDQFSLVKVPAELARDIMKAIGRTRLKGKKVSIRLERD